MDDIAVAGLNDSHCVAHFQGQRVRGTRAQKPLRDPAELNLEGHGHTKSTKSLREPAELERELLHTLQ